MANSNYIKSVAIVGAGGRSGKPMVESLLQTGKHTVTAITRADSQSELPTGVTTKIVDYDNPSTLIDALRGQDVLIITLSVTAPRDLHSKLVQAAAEAKVPWILPNEWGVDTNNEILTKDVVAFASMPAQREEIVNLGMSYIGVSTGFWYEWSLGMPHAFGVDFNKREVTFFDEGTTKITISTWAQVGRAVAALLSLPIRPESGQDACLEKFKNQLVFVSSFFVSQKDMFESALRVTKTKPEDWNVTYEPSYERYANGAREFQQGSMVGFEKMMYSRMFYPDGVGNYDSKSINTLLRLPKEDIDDFTQIAIERQKQPDPWTKEYNR